MRYPLSLIAFAHLANAIAIDPPLLGPPCFGMPVDPGMANALSWMPVAGALSYTVQLSLDPLLLVLSDEQTTSMTSVPMPFLQYESHYYWRVKANDGGGSSLWSSTCDFFTGINPATPAPLLMSPANGTATMGTTVDLLWENTPTTWFELQWASNAGFTGASSVNAYGNTYQLTGLANAQTYYWRVRRATPGGTGSWSTAWSFTTPAAATTVALRCFLQGPLNSGTLLMNDDLRSAGLVPATEPFTALGFTGIANAGVAIGPGVLATTGNNAIVDWVLVEARHATSSAVLARWAALLQRDGDVVLPSGGALSLVFPGTQARLAVRHRNHLGCMGNTVFTTNGGSITLDLTLTSTSVYGTEPTATVSSKRALWAGDCTGNGEIRYTGTNNDRDAVLAIIGGVVPTNTSAGYRQEDINMNGVASYTGAASDRDAILQSIGGVVPTNTRTQQLP